MQQPLGPTSYGGVPVDVFRTDEVSRTSSGWWELPSSKICFMYQREGTICNTSTVRITRHEWSHILDIPAIALSSGPITREWRLGVAVEMINKNICSAPFSAPPEFHVSAETMMSFSQRPCCRVPITPLIFISYIRVTGFLGL